MRPDVKDGDEAAPIAESAPLLAELAEAYRIEQELLKRLQDARLRSAMLLRDARRRGVSTLVLARVILRSRGGSLSSKAIAATRAALRERSNRSHRMRE